MLKKMAPLRQLVWRDYCLRSNVCAVDLESSTLQHLSFWLQSESLPTIHLKPGEFALTSPATLFSTPRQKGTLYMSVESTACLGGEEIWILPVREIFLPFQLFVSSVLNSMISGLNVTTTSKFTNIAVVNKLLVSFPSIGNSSWESFIYT